MVRFLDMDKDTELRTFIMVELGNKYDMQIDVYDDEIVKGTINGDEIVECLKVQFFPNDTEIKYIENEIANDVHRYIYENDLGLVKEPAIYKDVFLGEIRYNLIYTYAGDYHNCNECSKKCKHGEPVRCLYYTKDEDVI